MVWVSLYEKKRYFAMMQAAAGCVAEKHGARPCISVEE